MSRRIVIVVASILGVLAVLVAFSQRDRFTTAGRHARFLRMLERSDLVVRRSCYSMETFVLEARWSGLSPDDQQRAAEVLAVYCAEQGSTGQMTILDSDSRRKLGYWDGTGFSRVQ